MTSELAHSSWRLPPLSPDDLSPYGFFARSSDAEKAALWEAYRAGRATRVPVTLKVNDRVLLLDRRLVGDSPGYERMFEDAETMLIVQLRLEYLRRMRFHVFCDEPVEVPDRWQVSPFFQNIYEAAAFGAVIEFQANNAPCTRPILNDDNKCAIFDVNIDRPLELGIFPRGLEMTHRMRDLAGGKTFFGRPIEVLPYVDPNSDGPLTVAMNLRGGAILRDLLRDPGYASRLFDFIVTAGLNRRRAFLEYWKLPDPQEMWFADDSIATISTAQYREFILPHHRKWYDTIDPQHTKRRTIHLCGDATRHFPTIHEELGVCSFDTGFPVDFAALRRALGPDVEILGGVEAPLLLRGTPDEIYHRAEAILKSGISAGHRFILRDANNLPPEVPWPNLAAMYQAALDFGGHA